MCPIGPEHPEYYERFAKQFGGGQSITGRQAEAFAPKKDKGDPKPEQGGDKEDQ